MSWQASAWADSLPHDEVGYLAYRVLIKLCNVANETGTVAFRQKSDIARELGVSARSVQRAYRELEVMLLIRPGDQSYVQHIRRDRRPVVYALNFHYGKEYTRSGPLELVPALEAARRGDTVIHSPGVTSARGDTHGLHGETTVVAHRTINELERDKDPAQPQTRVSPSAICSTLDGLHRLTAEGSCWVCGMSA